MKPILERYLDRVLLYANLDEADAAATRKELKDHLLQKIDDLRATGLPAEDASLEALQRHGSPRVIGYKLRKPFPWIDIRSQGVARGVIAIGPRAIGIFAMGGCATGVFAFGGVAVGLFSMGGIALGLLFAFAGFSVGGLAYGGFTVGAVALGGFAVGLVATGGEALGLWVPHAGHAVSQYTSANVPPQLKSLERLLGLLKFIEHHPMIVWPLYGLGLLSMSLMQMREMKRVKPADDWLIDG